MQNKLKHSTDRSYRLNRNMPKKNRPLMNKQPVRNKSSACFVVNSDDSWSVGPILIGLDGPPLTCSKLATCNNSCRVSPEAGRLISWVDQWGWVADEVVAGVPSFATSLSFINKRYAVY